MPPGVPGGLPQRSCARLLFPGGREGRASRRDRVPRNARVGRAGGDREVAGRPRRPAPEDADVGARVIPRIAVQAADRRGLKDLPHRVVGRMVDRALANEDATVACVDDQPIALEVAGDLVVDDGLVRRYQPRARRRQQPRPDALEPGQTVGTHERPAVRSRPQAVDAGDGMTDTPGRSPPSVLRVDPPAARDLQTSGERRRDEDDVPRPRLGAPERDGDEAAVEERRRARPLAEGHRPPLAAERCDLAPAESSGRVQPEEAAVRREPAPRSCGRRPVDAPEVPSMANQRARRPEAAPRRIGAESPDHRSLRRRRRDLP